MPLTDAKVRALKGKSSPYKVSDGEGLFVLVTCVGSRLWSLAYRYVVRIICQAKRITARSTL